MKKYFIVYLALGITSIIWGGATAIGKFTLDTVPLSSLLFMRYFFSTIILVVFAVLTKRFKWISKKDLPLVLFTGFIATFVNVGLFYQGLSKTSAIDASIIYNTVPIITIIPTIIFLKERPSWYDISGLLLAFVGTLLIVARPYIEPDFQSSSTFIGILLMLGAAVVGVSYSFLAHKIPNYYGAINISIVMFFAGTVGFLPFAIADLTKGTEWLTQMTVPTISSVAYLVIFATAIAHSLWNFGLQKVEPSIVNLFIFIQPVASILIAIPLLKEEIDFFTVVGMLIIFAGIFIASRDDETQIRVHNKHTSKHS